MTGRPLVFPRSRYAAELLRIRWDLPVPREGEQTLDRDEVIERLRGDDPRPLLILRECADCASSDLALLRHDMRNERTLLLSRWFHCVKLPNHLLTTDHQFAEVFELPERTRVPRDVASGRSRAHLLLMDWSGEHVVVFDGAQAPRSLHRAMFEILDRSYLEDARRRLGTLTGLLNAHDRLAEEIEAVRERMEHEMDGAGADSADMRKFRAKHAELLERRTKLFRRELAALDLGLRDAGEKPEWTLRLFDGQLPGGNVSK